MSDLPSPFVDPSTAKDLLRTVTPFWAEFLEHLEAVGGRLEFRPEVADAIERLKLGNYPLLYEKEPAAGALLALTLLGAEEARAFDAEMRQATPEERGQAIKEIGESLSALECAFDFDQSKEAQAERLDEFRALPLDEQGRAIEATQRVFMGILAVVHDQLSIMVHGEKLSALVSRAKAGDDEAFLKAIQIDKRILSRVPYFDARFLRAHMQAERHFITAVSRKLEAPPYVGKLTHKRLWLAFSLLDGLRVLDSFSGNALLDLLQDVGVIDDEHPIDDVTNLLKLKARYRDFQARGGMSTP